MLAYGNLEIKRDGPTAISQPTTPSQESELLRLLASARAIGDRAFGFTPSYPNPGRTSELKSGGNSQILQILIPNFLNQE